MEKNLDIANRIEIFVRRLIERIGGTIDFAVRRGGPAQAGRTDLSAIIPQIERAVENHLRREGTQVIAPNLIELRYDYETYIQMGQKRREFLERELSVNIYEYIYNRRYATLGQTQIKIGYDAFTRGLAIKLDFGEPQEAVIAKGSGAPGAGNAAASADSEKKSSCEIALRGMVDRAELRALLSSNEEPVGIGRNVGNALIIKDSSVSNFHAALLIRPDGSVELADRASANGTFVNGVLLGEGNKTIVRDGDRVRFGEVEMMLTIKLEDGE